ncbi:hypothetical protein GGR55DRAFT_422079 [Xylaria sp. FL0064]|nr:hypothetical protein GGR55DRAFT_422079 [Xylaria sp. FL0064]
MLRTGHTVATLRACWDATPFYCLMITLISIMQASICPIGFVAMRGQMVNCHGDEARCRPQSGVSCRCRLTGRSRGSLGLHWRWARFDSTDI